MSGLDDERNATGKPPSEYKKEVRNRYEKEARKKEARCPTGGLHPKFGVLGPDPGLINWTSNGQIIQAAIDTICWGEAERKLLIRRAMTVASVQQPEPPGQQSQLPELSEQTRQSKAMRGKARQGEARSMSHQGSNMRHQSSNQEALKAISMFVGRFWTEI